MAPYTIPNFWRFQLTRPDSLTVVVDASVSPDRWGDLATRFC